MKITMYELYGKIYDENPPKHIKVYGEDWYWNDYDGYVTKESLKTTPDAQIYLMDRYRTFMNLDKEVEIIEEPKKIDNLMPKHLSNEFIQQIDKCITHQDIKCIAHKVNEVINYLQHINKEK